ncbi:helix-turn-helix domain-containing protein [Deinococcus aquaticus]|uniref:Helix-turn-helix domain-containing protein n=1 Tax=Deinococcus aquaticus TaxID=328692 RepID=A0ABY7UWV3_9DEIO|nr:helix-turn-helix domain-containing protein [Deinococcus aquaticus]WDA57373.1 hypothetical protein M8445_08285 [Deinococcus aquaticus]
MTAAHGVPAGIPHGLTAGQVARALNLKEETVKRALTTGALPSWRVEHGRGWRYVRPHDLATFAADRGLPLDWGELL